MRNLLGASEVNYANLGNLPAMFGPDGGGPAFKYVAALPWRMCIGVSLRRR